MTGDVVLMMDQHDGIAATLDTFDRSEFQDVLRSYAKWAQQNDSAKCCFQRVDKPGFPITEWAPAHVEQMRSDPDKAVEELSTIRTVTYDLRATQAGKETE